MVRKTMTTIDKNDKIELLKDINRLENRSERIEEFKPSGKPPI
jgi:hypothetical protein